MNENEPTPEGGKVHENVRKIDSAFIKKKVNELDLLIISLKNEIENLKAENLAPKNNTLNENDNIEKPQTVH